MSVTADEFFAIIPESVLYAPISDKAIRLYGVLRRHADKETGVGFPGQATLAKRMHCSVPSIKRATAELESIGAIRVERRYDPENPSHRLPNEYHVLTPGRFTGDPTPPITDEPTPEVMGDPLTIVTQPESVEPEKTLSVVDRFFDAFWEIYPRRSGKLEARKAFAKALQRDGVTPPAILEGVRRYRYDPNRENQFTKHPATWLNQGCWDDDPLPARSNGKGVTAQELAARAVQSSSTDDDSGPIGVAGFIEAVHAAVDEGAEDGKAGSRRLGGNDSGRIPEPDDARGDGLSVGGSPSGG